MPWCTKNSLCNRFLLFLIYFYAAVIIVQHLEKCWYGVTWISMLERGSSHSNLLQAGNLFHLLLWLTTEMSNKCCVSRNYFYSCWPAIYFFYETSMFIQYHLSCTGCSYSTSSDCLLIFPHLASNQIWRNHIKHVLCDCKG